MSVAEVSEYLGLTNIKNRQWTIQKTGAVSGEGLYEGLEWCATPLRHIPSVLRLPDMQCPLLCSGSIACPHWVPTFGSTELL
jgi:hypothetical protein